MKDYKELISWQKAMLLAMEIYKLTEMLPREERFGLSDQLRRACVSVPSNIAEGYGRESKNEYVRFLKISRGSLYEIETQLYLCISIGYLMKSQTAVAFALCTEISKMLTATIRTIQQ
ncbi:MAG: four helix bundle protein [Oscillospiraceae bacterium]|nr:four helix bundle protein [Oscillospiraceae bacterium]